ncbi:LamG domain-containing protein [Leptospira brenneri]|nr:LamG domain-containing protein [Leptospira brenneri]
MLKGPFCSRSGDANSVPIQPLLQYDFTNGSVVNAGSLTIALSTPEATPSLTLGKDGDTNGAINYTANNQYYSSGDVGLPMGTNPRTFCAWIKPTSLPANGSHRVVFRYGSITTGNFAVLAISTATGNKISFLGYGYDALADYTILVNTWSHLCASYSGGNAADFYVNGNFIASPSFVGSGPLNTISGSLAIGTWTGGGGPADYWQGAMDDIRIYGMALSAKQIGQIYQMGVAYVE